MFPRRLHTTDAKTTVKWNKGNTHVHISPVIQYQCNVITKIYLDATAPTNLDAHYSLDH